MDYNNTKPRKLMFDDYLADKQQYIGEFAQDMD